MTWMTKDYQLRAELSAQFSLANRRNPLHSRIARPEYGPGVCQVTKRLPKEQFFIGCALLNVVKRAVTRHTARAKQPQPLGSSALTTRLHTRFKLAQCRTTKVLCRTFLMPLRPHRGTIRCRKGRDGEILADRYRGGGTGRTPPFSQRTRIDSPARHRRNMSRYPRATHLWQHEERMTGLTGNAPRSLRPRNILILWNRGFHAPGPPWSICGKMNGTEAPCPVRGPNGISHRDRASPCTAIGSPACTANRITTSIALTSGECPIVSSCRKYSLQTFGPGAAP